jgi:cathepsin L
MKIVASNKANTSFTLGLNKFSDLTEEEFSIKFTGLQSMSARQRPRKYANIPPTNDDEVNWLTKGAVTAVKDQQQCGSCWAFSATGSMEGSYFLKNNKLQSLSEQQLVDCSTSWGNQGCNGGLMDQAFEYVEVNGITNEQTYPYTARDGACVYKPSMMISKIDKYVDVIEDESNLKTAVAQQPVSIAIYALTIMSYTGGIYNDYNACPSGLLDHGVLAIGYGTDSGQDYWLVKNSWGSSWGMNGYIKFARKSSGPGICGLATLASYSVNQ